MANCQKAHFIAFCIAACPPAAKYCTIFIRFFRTPPNIRFRIPAQPIIADLKVATVPTRHPFPIFGPFPSPRCRRSPYCRNRISSSFSRFSPAYPFPLLYYI